MTADATTLSSPPQKAGRNIRGFSMGDVTPGAAAQEWMAMQGGKRTLAGSIIISNLMPRLAVILSTYGVMVAIALLTAMANARAATKTPICHSIEEAARANFLPVMLLTRLVWAESRFQPYAISPAGAEGIAQFMPATATERGLSNPFVSDQAIRHAAALLADLKLHFGNIGLSVAAYNGGPGRIAKWLAGTDGLPRETRRFVIAVTGHSAEEWATRAGYRTTGAPSGFQPGGILATTGIGRERLIPRGPEHSGDPLPGMTQRGRVLPGFDQSGRIIVERPMLRRGLEHSGDPLPGTERRGRVLPGFDQSGWIIGETASATSPVQCVERSSNFKEGDSSHSRPPGVLGADGI